jgi:hypothetical protein
LEDEPIVQEVPYVNNFTFEEKTEVVEEKLTVVTEVATMTTMPVVTYVSAEVHAEVETKEVATEVAICDKSSPVMAQSTKK